MNQRTVVILVALAVVVGAGAWMAGNSSAPAAPVGQSQPLVPGLKDHVNDVASVSIVTKDDRFTVRKDSDGWKVVEKDDYPAKFETVKKTIVELGDMVTVEPKTSSPELYARIGVEDPEQKDSTSALITLLDASGKAMGAVIIGHNGSAQNTLYARRASEPQSWVVKSSLYLERKVERWLKTDLWKLPSSRVKSVVTVHGDGEQVSVAKNAQADADWVLAAVPEGQQPKSSSIGRVLAAALENVSFDSVAAASKKPLPDDDRVTTTFQTFDGLQVVVTTAKESQPAPAPGPDGKPPEAPTAKYWATIAVSAGADATDAVKTEATTAAAQLSPWVFQLAEYRATTLRKRMADMIQPIPAPSAEKTPAEPGAEPQPAPDGDTDELPVLTPGKPANPDEPQPAPDAPKR
jgi:Domain of unknown function (DUF4340)